MTASTLGDFGTALRQWRNRRRLSQIDLAIDAGTTQRHLSFLEQGRSAPGRDIVGRLADSLKLTLRQRNALLSAAGFAPSHPESPPDAPVLEPVRAALQHVLDGHLPYPAMVMDGFGEIEELESYGVPAPGGAPVESLGFAVPLHLSSPDGDVRLIATIATFVTALDVTVSELRLEAFLPADAQTAEILSRRHANQGAVKHIVEEYV
ncbi:helix-turn-helix transcriptional regulator [Mycolicibacterium sp. CBMA 361]|uniref:helix-turn-helix domain-containing protein n=1 Tax=Mycolicibacterium sp. CBMA 361 TaxID=2606610 RepID=UPI0012DD2146|nr:helix-turn-helix transcriptional regulator [Mycolicibacterium sp. CBMA 361]MUM31495.1 helix-turn-helix domain-containing protein [Mycolicibacterium sp. CBMA 361]